MDTTPDSPDRLTDEAIAIYRAWAHGIGNSNIRALMSEIIDHAVSARTRADTAERERDAARDIARHAEALARRLASDAMYALAGAVCTPEEGFYLAPFQLGPAIRELRTRAERAEAAEERVSALTSALEAVADTHTPHGDIVRGIARMALTPTPSQGDALMADIHVDVSNDAYIARVAICEEAAIVRDAMTRPSVLYRPTLMADGDMWMALYGPDLAVGVAGFGKTPEAAMTAFDEAWKNERTQAAIRAARTVAPSPGDPA